MIFTKYRHRLGDSVKIEKTECKGSVDYETDKKI